MDHDVLQLETFIPYRLNRLADAVSREFSRLYKDRFGLTRPEWRLLATLGQFGTMTATAVGTHSAMHKTKVSRAVAELERRRWLARKVDGEDRRVEHLSLTKAGLDAYRDMVPVALAFQNRLMAVLPKGDQAALLSGISALETALLAGTSGTIDAPG